MRISRLRLRNQLRSCLRSEARELQACSMNFSCALVCGFWSHRLAFPTQFSRALHHHVPAVPGVREPHPRPAGSLGTGRITGTHRCMDSTGRVPVGLSITRSPFTPHLTEIPPRSLLRGFGCPLLSCVSSWAHRHGRGEDLVSPAQVPTSPHGWF